MGYQQPRWLILDFFAAFARQLDNTMAIAHLIQLMSEFGMDQQTVRSSISRLKRKGWLEPDRVDGLPAYRISPTALRDLAEGDSRVYHLHPAEIEEGWCLVTFSLPESLKGQRHILRSKLTWWGFGNPAPGVWIAPERSAGYAVRTIESLGVGRYASVFHSEYVGVEPLQDFVNRAWEFSELSARYEAFLAENSPIQRRWAKGRPDAADARAFVDYLRMLNSWRSIPFLDPGLPLSLMPAGWKGQDATRLFHGLSDRLYESALAHVEAVTGRSRAPGRVAS